MVSKATGIMTDKASKYVQGTISKLAILATPLLLALIGYLLNKKLEDIEDRLAKLEGLKDRVIVLESKHGMYGSKGRSLLVPNFHQYAILNEEIRRKPVKT